MGARHGVVGCGEMAALDGVPSCLPLCLLTEACSSQTDENASSLSRLHIHSLLKRNVFELQRSDGLTCVHMAAKSF